jgi:hypothetical protein
MSPERLAVIAWHRWLILLPVLLGIGIAALALAWPELQAKPGPSILDAHQLARNGDWDTAFAMSRAYVLEHPEDPVGHFLLGQCYLYGNHLQFTISAGELETALQLHERTGSLGAWEGQIDSTEFRFRIYRVRATVALRIVRESLAFGLPISFIRQHLKDGLEQVNKALELKPGEKELLDMRDAMEQLNKDLVLLAPERSPGVV